MRILLILFLLITGFMEARPGKNRRKKRKLPAPSFRPAAIPIEQADNPELRTFFQNIKTLKQSGNKESILILGDSHNQCEDFGQALVSYLEDSAGIPFSGRNYAFPYPLARTSHRSPMQFSCRKTDWKGCRITSPAASCSWGICGWLASSEADSLEFAWKNGDNFRQGDGLGIFAPPSAAASYRMFLCDSSENREILYSDSLSAFFIRLQQTSKTMRMKAVRKDSGGFFAHQGFGRWPSAGGLSLGISGTNGARLDHYLMAPAFEKQIKALNPGLILLALGTNDAFVSDFSPEKIKTNLGMLVSRIRMALPGKPILLIGPPDHCKKKGRPNPNTEMVNEIYSEMAEALDLGFWNQQKSMGGKGSILAWRRQGLASPDLVHFSPGGYARQAKLLGRSMRQCMAD